MGVRCLIGVGSNLGDRLATYQRVIAALDEHAAIHVSRSSRPICSRPIGGPGRQGEFLNAAITITTSLTARELLRCMQKLEMQLGRQRGAAWSARTVDLDLLLYGEQVIDEAELRVPHPWMVARRFVLHPAAEIAATWIHPELGWSVERLWRHARTSPPRYSVLSDGALPWLAEHVEQLGGRVIPQAALPEFPGDSAIPGDAPSLELARRWAECLDLGGWNDLTSSQPLVSAFPLGKVKGPAPDGSQSDHEAAKGARDRLVGVLTGADGRTVPAKLVLIINRPGEAAFPLAATGTEAFRQRFAERRQVPYVVLAAEPIRDAKRLVAGAILAMDPPGDGPTGR